MTAWRNVQILRAWLRSDMAESGYLVDPVGSIPMARGAVPPGA